MSATRPVFFGAPDDHCSGVHHIAHAAEGKRPAVLMLNPFGEEAIRVFRVYRLLADRLARSGSHVLRFDYRATGDSAGACEEASLAGFVDSVLEADQELRDVSGAQRVVWLGLKLGAAVAVRAAAAAPKPPAGMLLWDPVVDGARYIGELARGHAATIADGLEISTDVAARRGFGSDGLLSEAVGFPISSALHAEIFELDLRTHDARPARKIAIIAADEDATALSAHFETLGAKTTVDDAPDSASWNSDQAMNAFVVPRATLDLIATRMSELK